MLNIIEPQDHATLAEEPAAFARGAGYSLGSLDGIVGIHVSFAAGAINKHLVNALEPTGLTQKQVAILWLVDEHPGITKSDLARLLWVERATIQIMVKSLVDRDLITQEPSSIDGRRIVLSLTDQGEAILPRAKHAVDEHERWLKERFSRDETSQTIDLMKRVYLGQG
jgi:DNA-binding MarR family transcriptional regulator